MEDFSSIPPATTQISSEEYKRMPTGISSLDPVFEGGIPPGSVTLLLGEIGSGHEDFVNSSIMYLTKMKPQGSPSADLVFPETITYISFTKDREDIINDIKISYKSSLTTGVEAGLNIIDLSQIYFENSVVPANWYSESDIVERLKTRKAIYATILGELTETLENVPANSLIVFNSLTDLAVQYAWRDEWGEFTAFLKGLQRIAKRWNTSFYLLLTSGIIPSNHETEIADAVDAVISFKWEDAGAGRRQRVMYFEKFRGVMPHLEERDLVKFAVKITAGVGFDVTNIRVVI